MNKRILSTSLILAFAAISCGAPQDKKSDKEQDSKAESHESGDFNYTADQFADLRIIRYQAPGFEELPTEQKELLYYLYEAALAGRDIIYDQNYQHNLQIRKVLEQIVKNEENYDNKEEFEKLLVYTKRVWFSNGIHHHYSNAKFEPEFSKAFFGKALEAIDAKNLPLKEGQSKAEMTAELSEVIFNPEIASKKVALDAGVDLVQASAINFYGEDVIQKEVEAYYASLDKVDENQPEYGLNNQLVKKDGKVVANTWKVGGMYSSAIERIVKWLSKAAEVAENEEQKLALERLVTYYKSGDVSDWDQYNIAWVNDTSSRTDVVNGFIEVYNDPLGYKGSFESVVSFKDREATKRIEAVSKEAQWFEDNSPLMEEHKKKNVKGITGKVITVVVESGDASPSTPIGINLPNNNWIREHHGSKSVSLGNIVHAYEMSSKEGKSSLTEFAYSEEEVERSKKYGSIADLLHTDLHEVIGHASGVINEGVGTPKETLKNYASTLEEGRADLVALYYLHDKKLVEMGLMPSLDAGKTAYDDYIKNGLMLQLKRLDLGDQIEEAHMRNRQLVAKWAYEKGKADKVIEKKTKDGKTYFVINDYEQLRDLFGQLLRELQRIKSEGDFEAGKALVENYGVKVDPELHAEVLKRYEKLNIAPYGGFINPKLVPVMKDGKITDVNIEYPADFKAQMLYYGDNYSNLKVK
jgi:dipeptidyl-peptidase-3